MAKFALGVAIGSVVGINVVPSVSAVNALVGATSQEQRLSQAVSQVFADGQTIYVNCFPDGQGSILPGLVKGEDVEIMGYVRPFNLTKRAVLMPPIINIEASLCDQADVSLVDPASETELNAGIALGVIDHEVQHVLTGSIDEAATQCRTGQLLQSQLLSAGYPTGFAGLMADVYVNGVAYPAEYSSPECRPGGQLDMGVPGAVFPIEQLVLGE